MLSDAVNRHIELYRSMGFKYKVQAYMLHSFAAFAESRSEEFIQTDYSFGMGEKVLRRPVNAMIACLPFAAWPVHSMQKTSAIRCLRSMSSATRQRGVGPAIFSLRTKSIVFCKPPHNSHPGDRYSQ